MIAGYRDDIFAFVSGAAERLSDREGFPWRSAVHALTCVDDVVALAAISRWADDGTAKSDGTLEQFLLTALRRGIIGPETSASLAMLIGGSDADLRRELASQAIAEPQKYKEVLEQLAKETLLFSPQGARLPLGQEIVDWIPTHARPGGPWLAHLGETIAFLRHTTDHRLEEALTIRPNKTIKLANDKDLLKEFQFDPQGDHSQHRMLPFSAGSESSGLQHHDRDLLRRMRDGSSGLRDRIPFLNALAGVPEG